MANLPLDADDFGGKGFMLALPAWPCQQSMGVLLWGPRKTSVEVSCHGENETAGALLKFEVSPPERRAL